MTLVESTAAFGARCKALGITDVDVAALAANQLNSFGAFAFIVPCVGGAVDDVALKAALEAALGNEPNLLAMPRYRRLHFECHALVLSDTKSRVDRTDESLPRKLPMPERTQRHEAQVAKLVGISITDWNEPSHTLLDMVQQQLEDAMVRHIPVELCTCRMQELSGVKKELFSSTDKAGFIKVGERDAALHIECGQDFFNIRQALLRRSLAYDQSNIIQYSTMEAWHSYLFETMQREAPPGHNKVSLHQALSADRQIFARISESCRHGLAPGPRGELPADIAMKALQVDMRITTFILQLPGSGAGSSKVLGNNAPSEPKEGKRFSWKEHKAAIKTKAIAAPYQAPAGKGHKGGAKGGKGAKGKGKGNRPSRPPGLEGTWTTHKGKAMCDAFNLGNCSEAGAVTAGQSCSKGLHVCCKPFCGESHAYHQCTKH